MVKIIEQPMAKLPEGILASDTKYPTSYNRKSGRFLKSQRVVGHFELWNVTGFGWCIPTLLIRRGRFKPTDRTYAARVADGAVVRIGMGPHVLSRCTVYVTQARQANLQKYLDLQTKGEGDAGMIRDRISTRRAQTAMRRMAW